MKATAAALQLLPRATAIRGELRLTSAAIKTRRGITELFRGSLVTNSVAEPSSPMQQQTGQQQASSPSTGHKRLVSVDALRGFDMFWIIGGESLFAPLLPLTGLSAFAWGQAQMQHSAWHGFTLYDLIFPLFIFLSGVTLGLANKSLRGQPLQLRQTAYKKAVKRLLILIGLGVLYNHGWGSGIPLDLSEIRYASVLARIGFAWFFAALIVWHCRPSAQYLIFVSILFGYWLLQLGLGGFSRSESINAVVDHCCLPGITYQGKPYDPEGLLSTLPAVANALAGVFAGRWLHLQGHQPGRLLRGLFLAGITLFALGWTWNLIYPVNKDLWTGSFSLVTIGCSLLLLGCFYLIVEIWKWRWFTMVFAVIGCNAILVYMASSLVNWTYTSKSLFGGIASVFSSADAANLVIVIGVLAVQWIVLHWLYRRNLFISP
ncbi:transmembrane glucosamine N-acetyltransferase NagX [Microbulbifer sp. TRSA002]